MTTTKNWLQSQQATRLALSFVIEGIDTAWTTADIGSEMATAFTGTDFSSASWNTGLFITGNVSDEIRFFDPSVNIGETIHVRILDVAAGETSVFQKLSRDAYTWTYIDADVDCDDTTINALRVDDFPASATDVYAGLERMRYTSRDTAADTFTIGTRGRYNIFSTTSGGRWARSHKTDQYTAFLPEIATGPITFYNRGCILRLHHRETTGAAASAWSTHSDARILFVGRIKNWTDRGDGTIDLSVQTIREILKADLKPDYEVDAQEGGYLLSPLDDTIVLSEYVSGVALVEDNASMFGSDGQRTYAQVAQAIRDKIQDNTLAMGETWRFEQVSTPEGYRYQFHVVDTGIPTTTIADFTVGLSPLAWVLLGFDHHGSQVIINGGGVVKKFLQRSGDDWYLTADFAPVTHRLGLNNPDDPIRRIIMVDADSARGTYSPQSTLPTLTTPLPSQVTGFLEVGDLILAVGKIDSSSFQCYRDVTRELKPTFTYANNDWSVVRYGQLPGGQTRLRVRQIWWEKDATSSVILRMLLSTGTTNFNDSTYDKNPATMAVNCPASVVNGGSFRDLDETPMSLVISKSVNFLDLLESTLAIQGRHLVMKDGKITVIRPRLDGGAIAASHDLTEATKASSDPTNPQRSSITHSTEGLVNIVTLKHSRQSDGTFGGEITIPHVGSINKYGQRRAVTVESFGLRESDVLDWAMNVAGPALALFSKPLSIVRRSFHIGFSHMVPGDTVLIDDDYICDPATGQRGVTDVPGWVRNVTFDYESGVGQAEIAIFTEFDYDRIAAWSPTARVDETQANAGYDAVNIVLTCYAHAFSDSSQAVDVSRFATDDVIQIQELSPPNPAAPLSFNNVVVSVDTTANEIKLQSALGAWDNTKKYIVLSRPISVVDQSQREESYLADDATNSTGAATNDAYMYGGAPDNSSVSYGTEDYNTRYVRIRNIADDAGEPMSIGDYYFTVLGTNNWLSHKSYVQMYAGFPNRTVTGTTFTLAHGPVWVPIFGPSRQCMVRLHVQHTTGASSATFRIKLANQLVRGTSDTSLSYSPDTPSELDLTSNSTTPVWLTASGLLSFPIAGNPPGVWLTVEVKAGGAGETASLFGISMYEDDL